MVLGICANYLNDLVNKDDISSLYLLIRLKKNLHAFLNSSNDS